MEISAELLSDPYNVRWRGKPLAAARLLLVASSKSEESVGGEQVVARSSEFENVQARDDENQELVKLLTSCCPIKIKTQSIEGEGIVIDQIAKVNILLQSYISKADVDGFALVADMNHVVQSAGRIFRALFELCVKKGFVTLANKLLTLNKVVTQRVWPHQHALRQVCPLSFPPLLHAQMYRYVDGGWRHLVGIPFDWFDRHLLSYTPPLIHVRLRHVSRFIRVTFHTRYLLFASPFTNCAHTENGNMFTSERKRYRENDTQKNRESERELARERARQRERER